MSEVPLAIDGVELFLRKHLSPHDSYDFEFMIEGTTNKSRRSLLISETGIAGIGDLGPHIKVYEYTTSKDKSEKVGGVSWSLKSNGRLPVAKINDLSTNLSLVAKTLKQAAINRGISPESAYKKIAIDVNRKRVLIKGDKEALALNLDLRASTKTIHGILGLIQLDTE
jgi:hypothetical protein